MPRKQPDTGPLALLRAVYDLLDVHVCPTPELLARLSGAPPRRIRADLGRLRQARLLQQDRLGLSMAGLAVAVGLPPFEVAGRATA